MKITTADLERPDFNLSAAVDRIFRHQLFEAIYGAPFEQLIGPGEPSEDLDEWPVLYGDPEARRIPLGTLYAKDLIQTRK